MLQTRSAKRPAQAAVRFACDVVDEGLLTKAEAIATIDCEKLDALLHPTFDPNVDYAVLAKGVAASPGAAKGEIVFSAPDAVAAAAEDRDVILVRPFTEAEDVAGFYAARGILTAEGGKASHAALVARGMGRPAVTGASALDIDLAKKQLRVGDTVLGEGDMISIDGTTGQITVDDVPLVEPEMTEYFQRVLEWSDELRRLGVRANADTPRGRAQGARVRRRGHRPVPHRAHVHGRRPPAEDARDDPLGDRRRARRGARRAAAAAAAGLRGGARGDGRAAGHDPPARPAAARVPAARRGRPPRARAARGQPDARHARLPAGDPASRDLRDAGPRDHARAVRRDGAPRPSAAARGHGPADRLRARAGDHQGR